MTAIDALAQHFAACPLIAILRGVTPDEAEAIAGAVVEAGIRIVEVPLNSPAPFESIGRIARAFADRALIGAGTVLDPDDVDRVREGGGRLIVAPGTDLAVIRRTVALGMVSAPGFFTPSEAIAALSAGAHALKLFPAEAASPAVVKAMKAVLPTPVPLVVVGGVTPESMAAWRAAGADGFGLGSGLYAPGRSAKDTAARAHAYVAALT